MDLFRNIAILLLILVFTISCGDDEAESKTPPKYKYEDFVDSKVQAVINQLNFVVHKGDTPPTVVGKYWGNHIKLATSTLSNDNLKDYDKVGEMVYDLFNQKPNNTISSHLILNYKHSDDDKESKSYMGEGTLITGSDNKFTVYSIHSDANIENGKSSEKGKLLYILSAEIEKDEDGKSKALKNTQALLVMLDGSKGTNVVSRVFKSMNDAELVD